MWKSCWNEQSCLPHSQGCLCEVWVNLIPNVRLLHVNDFLQEHRKVNKILLIFTYHVWIFVFFFNLFWEWQTCCEWPCHSCKIACHKGLKDWRKWGSQLASGENPSKGTKYEALGKVMSGMCRGQQKPVAEADMRESMLGHELRAYRAGSLECWRPLERP